MRSKTRVRHAVKWRAGGVALSLLAALWVHGCATGSETDVGADDEDAGGSRIDAGRLPDPAKPDGSVEPTPDAGKPDATTTDACAQALAAITFAFDSGDQGWTHGASDGITGSDPAWPYDGWTRGTASAGTACKAGSCFGNELTQNYAQCARGYLQSPAIDLSKCSGRNVSLVFQHAYAFWSGTYNAQNWFDGGIVEVSTDGQTWQVPPASGVYSGTVAINPDRTSSYQCVTKPFGVTGKQGFTGKNATMTKVTIPLPAAAISATTRIRFSMASGVSSQTTNANTSRSATDFGWRIDDVGFEVK